MVGNNNEWLVTVYVLLVPQDKTNPKKGAEILKHFEYAAEDAHLKTKVLQLNVRAGTRVETHK